MADIARIHPERTPARRALTEQQRAAIRRVITRANLISADRLVDAVERIVMEQEP